MITRMRGKAVGSLLAVISIALLVLLLVFNECSENRKEKERKRRKQKYRLRRKQRRMIQ